MINKLFVFRIFEAQFILKGRIGQRQNRPEAELVLIKVIV